MDIKRIIESLSPNERKILPYVESKNVVDICKKSTLDKTSVLRALEYLKNKKIVEFSYVTKKIIELGVNGALYKQKGLPERRLLNLLDEKRIISLKDVKKEGGLSDDELKASLGVLKKKAMIEIKKDKIILSASKGELVKKTLEELFLENLPIDYDSMTPEQIYAFKSLSGRKELIFVKEEKIPKLDVTEIGKKIVNADLKGTESIESVTPELLKKDSNWKGKKFRRYDVVSKVPDISGGKRHFVNQSIDYGRKIWTDMGFKEMYGDMIQSSFWNFDALFTAQDHPVREMQDTFFIDKKADLSDIKIVKNVKETHEKGVDGSKGWRYEWNEEEAKKMCLRTHTTCLSAQKLYELSKLPIKQRNGKFFALGKNFRNETVDWSHGFEFYQTEGIVIDENVTFRHLLGYLKQFYKKMGFEKIKFAPGYFPYTEPSVETHVWHPEKKVWLELGGAGVFRPEISIPLLGKKTPILAWGQGFDRIIMDYYEIKDLRELYKNDLTKLRKVKFWVK